jgi:hypothetical protein
MIHIADDLLVAPEPEAQMDIEPTGDSIHTSTIDREDIVQMPVRTI